MTCQELHCYLENPLRLDVYLYRETLPVAVSEHLAACRDCARLFEEQKALGIKLNLARDAAPRVPESLDASVLADYRRQLAQMGGFGVNRRTRWSFSNPWVWGVATAALITVAALLLVANRNTAPTVTKKSAVQSASSPYVAKEAPDLSGKQGDLRAATKVAKTEAHWRPAKASRGIKSPLPPGFSSLMYCDDLSCSGAMEVIRVELPATGPTPTSGGTPAMAEVLVGTDGIARGIRIVQ